VNIATKGTVGLGAPRPLDVEVRTFKPIKLWAAMGVFFAVLETWVIVTWITSGKAKETTAGRSVEPGWMKFGVTFQEILYCIVALIGCYFFVVRPWRRDKHISLDGMLFLIFALLYWQDPITNYIQPYFGYNADFFNLGSWVTNIPGWISPHGNLLPEPLIASGPIYPGWVFLFIVIANYVMRKAKERYPRLGTFGLVMVCFGFLALSDLVFECIFVRTGYYVYAATWGKDITLFSGHYYQFPLYEPVLWGGVWTVWACLRYFKNDKGQTVAERGVDELRSGAKPRRGLRILALYGICNGIFMLYNVPMIWVSTQVNNWSTDVQSRPYLTDGMCGPGTTYACPGPGTPIFKPHSIHITPEGKIIVPQGVKLPPLPGHD
jgi:hypothetical protein